MDVTAPAKALRIKRWLPYWAVLQADMAQTLRSWVYRVSVLLTLLAAIGYLLYRIGIYREAGIIQPASGLISDLLRWSVLGGVALVIIVTGGSISGDRGILADSVLSRGISRYQYFLGKWHARVAVVLGTFLAMGVVAFAGSYLFLHEDMSLAGSLVALATVLAIFAVVATCGVAVSALSNSTAVGIAALWVIIYGVGFGLSFLPAEYPTPDRALANLPHVLRGLYDLRATGRLLGYAGAASGLAALLGLARFSRCDV